MTEEAKAEATVLSIPQMPVGGQVTVSPHKVAPSAPFLRVGARAMLVPRDLGEAMEFAKLMCKAEGMVVPALIGNPGACLGVILQAMDWGLSPYAVAQKCYLAKKPDKDGPLPVLSYESQLIHAVIEKNAPIKGRLQHEFVGEGPKRQCRVWGTFTGENEPRVYVSPEIGKITPKNSPLWNTKPDLQLFYNATRDWARMYCPDVIMGAYSKDELIDAFTVEAPKREFDPFAGEGPKISNPGSQTSPQPDEPGASDSPTDAPGDPDTPKKVGARFKAEGKSESDNPYPENSSEWLAFIEGYHEEARA